MIRNLFFFVVLIGFVTSTLIKTSENPSSNRDILEKHNLRDLKSLNNKSLIEIMNSKLEKDGLKSNETLQDTITYRLIKKIYSQLIEPNYRNMQIKVTNEIFYLLINNISENTEHYIYNDFFNEIIINLTGIYLNFIKNNITISENFNRKIIPIINKIIYPKNIDNNIDIIYSSKKKFLIKFIDLFQIFTGNKNFFLNLVKNIEIRKLFINVITEFIVFEKDKEYTKKYKDLISNFLNYYYLVDLDNNDPYKKVYFQTIDCFLENYIKILEKITFNNMSFRYIIHFLHILFENKYYLKNISDLEILTKAFKCIASFGFNTENHINSYAMCIIYFYTKAIPEYSVENNKKAFKIIKMLETIIEKFIYIISNYEINSKEYNYHTNLYSFIYQYLYCLNINFENNKFYNQNLINNIVVTLKNYIKKIAIYEYIRIGFDETKINENYILNEFLQNNNINFKKEISNKVSMQIELLSSKTSEKKEITEEIFLTIIDRYLFINVFKHEFIDINEIKNRDLVKKMLETYINIFKSAKNIEDLELNIILSLYIKNSSEKLDIDKISKNNFLERIKKLTFKEEIQGFIEKRDGVDFKKLFIVKYINAIKESKNKILEDLEKLLNKEDFKIIMINFIYNFKKLDIFYNTETNNNPEFRKTVYNDFMEIFFCEVGIKWCEDYKIYKKKFFWREKETRKEIYKNFAEKFTFFNSNFENKYEPKHKKQRLE